MKTYLSELRQGARYRELAASLSRTGLGALAEMADLRAKIHEDRAKAMVSRLLRKKEELACKA